MYISPAQLLRTGKAIKINPMEGYGGFGLSGHRVCRDLAEDIQYQGCPDEPDTAGGGHLPYAAEHGDLGLLRRIILDQAARDEILADVNIRDNLDFWYKAFPKIKKKP